jgi:hypothetical protein
MYGVLRLVGFGVLAFLVALVSLPLGAGLLGLGAVLVMVSAWKHLMASLAAPARARELARENADAVLEPDRPIDLTERALHLPRVLQGIQEGEDVMFEGRRLERVELRRAAVLARVELREEGDSDLQVAASVTELAVVYGWYGASGELRLFDYTGSHKGLRVPAQGTFLVVAEPRRSGTHLCFARAGRRTGSVGAPPPSAKARSAARRQASWVSRLFRRQ